MSREWAMPNAKTFKIKPIRDLIERYSKEINPNNSNTKICLDPFANEHPIATTVFSNWNYISNNIDSQYNCNYNLDAEEFLKQYEEDSIDLVLNDPVWTLRQLSEVYKRVKGTVTMEDTQSTSRYKKAIARVAKMGGYVISCGFNSNGIGKGLGFEIVEILLVAHGGSHNDSIVVVERKVDNPTKLPKTPKN